MDDREVNSAYDLNTVLGTIFLFLKNQNFFKTSEAFKDDCAEFGVQLPNISGKVFFRTDQKINTFNDCTQQSKSRKFVEKRIILETFIQENLEDIQEIKEANLEHFSGPSQQSLKNKFGQLQEEYKNLLAVTSELTKALQMNVMSQAKSFHYVLDQCKTIYPTLFQMPSNEDTDNGGQDVMKKSNQVPLENIPQTNIEKAENGNEFLVNNIPCIQIQIPNSDENKQDCLHKSNSQPLTPLSQEEIKEILETVLNKTMYFLNEKSKNELQDCCYHKEACAECREEIVKILEKILMNVTNSPRSNESCCHSVERSLRSGRSDLNFVETPPGKEHGNLHPKTQQVGQIYNAKVNNNTIDNLLIESCNVQGLERKLICRSVECPKRSSIVEKRPVTEGNNCFHLDCLSKIENPDFTGGKVNQREPIISSNDQFNSTNTGEEMENMTENERKTVKPIQRFVKFQTPLCYMENCRRLQDGNKNCRCSKCVPGKSRYHCGCYDQMCKELDEETDGNMEKGSTWNKINFFRKLHNYSEASPKVLEQYIYGNHCHTCNDVICKCAFESRPRIRRTPPE